MTKRMEFHTEKRILRVLFGILIAACLISVIFSIVTSNEYSMISGSYPQRYQEGWTDLSNGYEITGQYITIPPKESKTILKTLPDQIDAQSMLSFYGSNLMTNIRLIPSNDAVGETCEVHRGGDRVLSIFFPIDTAFEGAQILITFSNYSIAPVRVNMKEFYFGTEGQLISKAWKDSALVMVLSVLMVCVAAGMLIFTSILLAEEYDKFRSAITYTALVLVSAAVWFFMMTPIAGMMSEHPRANIVILFSSYYFISPLALLVYRELLPNWRKALTHLLILVTSITTIVLIALTLDSNISTWTMLTISHVMLGGCCIVALIMGLIDYRKERQEIVQDTIISNVIFLIGGALTITQMFWWPQSDTIRIYRIFFLVGMTNMLFVLVETAWKQFDDLRAERHFRTLAYRDPVTGGNSAAYMEEEFSKLDLQKEHWFIYLNIKRFKIINGTIGKDRADSFLRTLYHGLESKLNKDIGERIAYLGNANFGIIALADDEVALKGRLMGTRYQMLRILDEFLSSLHIQAETCIYHIRVGERIDLRTATDYCLMASENPNAEYIAILNGYLYNEQCRQKLLREEELQNMLAGAILRKEIKPYYQPKIDPRTGAIVGAEALARWDNERYGLISPNEFIPIFEQNGSIAEIDLSIFEQVCEQIMTWIHNGKKPPVVSVNYSKAYILMKNQFYRYQRIIDKVGVPAKYLEFEFTESLAYDDMEQIHELMDAIHAIGARCAMDDFGKSYSNLNALGDLPFDVVKMDMSFFSYGFPGNERQMRMVRDTVKLLQDLQTEVVAEGIESKAQVEVLRDLNVSSIQGFYYSKPLPRAEFEQFMEGRQVK